MGKDPAFLFYPNDYIGGTMGMSFEEKGAYVELLIMQFNRGHMTEHMIVQTVGQIWAHLKDKFSVDEDGLYYNKRLDEEKEKRRQHSEKQRENVMKRWNKQQLKKFKTPLPGKENTKSIPNGYHGNTVVIPLENENRNVNVNTSNTVKEKESIKEKEKKLSSEQIKVAVKIFGYLGLTYQSNPNKVMPTQLMNHSNVHRFLELYGDTVEKIKYINSQIVNYDRYCKDFNHKSVTKMESFLGYPDNFDGILTQCSWKEMYNKKSN